MTDTESEVLSDLALRHEVILNELGHGGSLMRPKVRRGRVKMATSHSIPSPAVT